MNCFSRERIDCASRLHARRLAGRLLAAFAVCLTACGAPASEPQSTSNSLEYSISYRLAVTPADSSVRVELDLEQPRRLLREMSFDNSEISAVSGDGEIQTDGSRLIWQPPERGGKLSWQVTVANRRNGDGYDAWIGPEWGLFRAEDVIPRAATRTLKGATSETTMAFRLPRGWSAVSEYGTRDGKFVVRNLIRRFVQPAGWIVVGELGVRRDRIAGVRVAIAAPEDQQVRRLDMMALLNWTLPELSRIVPELPARLTVVSAGEPMWRGALSAPQSIYVHAERPIISENGTSTLLHELMHVALGTHAEDDVDWMLEGLAEYYSLELLARSGTLTESRHTAALARQKQWSASAESLCGRSSSGATTALAVVTFRALDTEIREATANEASLDDVVRALWELGQPLSLASLQAASTEIAGKKPDALHIDRLPGCRKLSAAEFTD